MPYNLSLQVSDVDCNDESGSPVYTTTLTAVPPLAPSGNGITSITMTVVTPTPLLREDEVTPYAVGDGVIGGLYNDGSAPSNLPVVFPNQGDGDASSTKQATQ